MHTDVNHQAGDNGVLLVLAIKTPNDNISQQQTTLMQANQQIIYPQQNTPEI